MHNSAVSQEGAWQRAIAEATEAWNGSDELRLGLLYLKSWPDIPAMPPEVAAPAARVCALLAHKPTVGFLVARVLELREGEVRLILQALHRLGHVEVLHRKAEVAPIDEAPPAAAPGPFLGRLWKALVSR